MDFYEAQARARRRTRRLVALFALVNALVVFMLSALTLLFVVPPLIGPGPVGAPISVSPGAGVPSEVASYRVDVGAGLPGGPAGFGETPGRAHSASSSGMSDATDAPPSLSPPPSAERASPNYTVLQLFTHAPQVTGVVVSFWLLLIGGAVLYRTFRLSRSGAIARWLGGSELPAQPQDARERMLRNVVEEMSIASGIPTPRIYVLRKEGAINAVAAGFSPSDATLSVTGGALHLLDRDQLQGVVAHEFSHILNGDMRMNVRLIAWISGLIWMASLPMRVVRVAWPLPPLALVLTIVVMPLAIVGMLGGVPGRLLQAAISRQREWLADASAVQFTRNPDGLRRALAAVGRVGGTGLLGTPAAQEAAHLFFVPAVRRCVSTHPRLKRRVQALERAATSASAPAGGAQGLIDAGLASRTGWGVSAAEVPAPFMVSGSAVAVRAAITAAAVSAADQVGQLDIELAEQARGRMQSLPAAVREVASPGDAQALLLAIALSPRGDVQRVQRAAIERALGGDALAAVIAGRELTREMPARVRLPAVQHLFPQVRALPAPQREVLAALLARLALADGDFDLFEFCLARLASTWLRDSLSRREPTARRHLGEVRVALGTLLSVLATFGHQDDEAAARQAFAAGVATLGAGLGLSFERPSPWADNLWRAFDRLDALAPADRRAVIAAMAAVVMHDGLVGDAEADLLRTASAALHCPLPLIPSGAVAEPGRLSA